MTRKSLEIINPFCAGCKRGSVDVCCVGCGSWLDFTRSYINATKILATSLKGKNPELFYPLAFMLRHSIELIIKNELIEKCKKSIDEVLPKGGKNICGTHKLNDLANSLLCDTKLRNYITKNEIDLFDKYDNGSFEFRYPMDKNGNNTCKNLCCFGLDEVTEICDNMLNFLDSEYPNL